MEQNWNFRTFCEVLRVVHDSEEWNVVNETFRRSISSCRNGLKNLG